MRFPNQATYSAVLAFFFLSVATAKEVALYSVDGSTVPGYLEKLDTLEPGDDVVFSDGTRLKVGKRLGNGNLTTVFDLVDHPESVIRLPSNGANPQRFTLEDARTGISSFAKGERALAEFGIAHANAKSGLDRQFLVVRKIPDGHSSLTDFLKLPAAKVSREQRSALVDFFRSVSGFAQIGDFHGEQLRYVPQRKKWVLIDWTSNHRSAYDLDYKEGNVIAVNGQVGDAIFKPDIPVARESWVTTLQSEIENETRNLRAATIAKGASAVERYFDMQTMAILGPKFSFNTVSDDIGVGTRACSDGFARLSSLR